MPPRRRRTCSKGRLGQITRQGEGDLSTLLVHGARAYLRVADKKTDSQREWAQRLEQRRQVIVAAVAPAAKPRAATHPVLRRRVCIDFSIHFLQDPTETIWFR